MRILAIETVGITGSVAAFEGERLIGEMALDPARRSARSLAPGIAELLANAGWTPRDVQLVAVANGPGSFTGLRIGVTTAKAFAYATGAEAIGVNTLEVIGSRVPGDISQFSVALDAQRSELFVADFWRDADGSLVGEATTRVEPADSWLAGLKPGAVLSGPVLGKLGARVPPGVTLVDESLWKPTAAAVGEVAWRDYSSGRHETVFELAVRYYRRTAAEEQWERRQKA